MKISYYRIFLAFVDIALINLAISLAFLIRFDGSVPEMYWYLYRHEALPLTCIYLAFFYVFGLYNQVWVYASINALMSIIDAVLCGSFFAAVYLWAFAGARLPYSVLIVGCLLDLMFVGGSRFAWRVAREKLFNNNHIKRKNALIFGAGDAGEAIVREMVRSNGNSEYLAVGFIDDDPNKKGMSIHGVKVLGNRRDIPRIARSTHIHEVILAAPSTKGEIIKDIVSICKSVGVRSKTLPAIYELINGQVSISQIRDVNEEDLLKREPIKFDLKEVECEFKDKTVLITGAGGSIGSELCRQIIKCHPNKLILLGHGENSIYQIDMELASASGGTRVVPVIANIRDKEKMRRVIGEHHPQVIFHAAAYKHVWMMERNPDEAYMNNVVGTKVAAEVSLELGVERFVLVSTDKAVHPTSIMGSTKQQAELAVLGMQGTGKTKFIITRFGNVMNSRGSVIPLFKKQISQRQPVTITHPDVVRFFMTIPEAAHLVIRAAAMGQGGEVFVLDMGEPIKILDLAKELITLSGLEPDRDIPIKFVGLRPGEKLAEQLAAADETLEKTAHKKIFVVRPLKRAFGDQQLSETLKGERAAIC